MASAREHLTGPEVTRIIEQIAATANEREEPLMAITQRQQDGPFYAWVIDERTVFDPTAPLTGDLEEPSQKMITVRWQRTGSAPATARIPRHGQEFHTGGEQDRPWETAHDGYYAQRLLLCDQAAVDQWAQERLLYEDAQAFAEPLRAVAARARESLREGWLERETEIARRAFLATGHEEDWAEHAATLKLEWPYERSGLGRRWHSELVVDQAIDWALERGMCMHGATVAAAFDMAVKAGLRGGWVPASEREGVDGVGRARDPRARGSRRRSHIRSHRAPPRLRTHRRIRDEDDEDDDRDDEPVEGSTSSWTSCAAGSPTHWRPRPQIR